MLKSSPTPWEKYSMVRKFCFLALTLGLVVTASSETFAGSGGKVRAKASTLPTKVAAVTCDITCSNGDHVRTEGSGVDYCLGYCEGYCGEPCEVVN